MHKVISYILLNICCLGLIWLFYMMSIEGAQKKNYFQYFFADFGKFWFGGMLILAWINPPFELIVK